MRDKLNMVGKDFVKSSENENKAIDIKHIRKRNIEVINSSNAFSIQSLKKVDQETKALYKREENT